MRNQSKNDFNKILNHFFLYRKREKVSTIFFFFCYFIKITVKKINYMHIKKTKEKKKIYKKKPQKKKIIIHPQKNGKFLH